MLSSVARHAPTCPSYSLEFPRSYREGLPAIQLIVPPLVGNALVLIESLACAASILNASMHLDTSRFRSFGRMFEFAPGVGAVLGGKPPAAHPKLATFVFTYSDPGTLSWLRIDEAGISLLRTHPLVNASGGVEALGRVYNGPTLLLHHRQRDGRRHYPASVLGSRTKPDAADEVFLARGLGLSMQYALSGTGACERKCGFELTPSAASLDDVLHQVNATGPVHCALHALLRRSAHAQMLVERQRQLLNLRPRGYVGVHIRTTANEKGVDPAASRLHVVRNDDDATSVCTNYLRLARAGGASTTHRKAVFVTSNDARVEAACVRQGAVVAVTNVTDRWTSKAPTEVGDLALTQWLLLVDAARSVHGLSTFSQMAGRRSGRMHATEAIRTRHRVVYVRAGARRSDFIR